MSDQPATDLTAVIDRLMEGGYDDHLSDLFTAVLSRVREMDASTSWKITIGDVEVLRDDITLDEWATAEKLAGKSWAHLQVRLVATDMRAVITALYHHRSELGELSLDEAKAKAGALSGSEMFDRIEDVVVQRPPLSAGR